MENAVEAIQMAFAVMVFVLALSVSVFSFNSAKAASDVMLYAQDETNYYDYQEVTGKAEENRTVGMETIVPTLYKYYKENYTVVFRQGNYNPETGELTKLKYLPVYETASRYKSDSDSYLWGTKVKEENFSTYDELMKIKYNLGFFEDGYNATATLLKGNKEIFSFDVEEETLRHEPWTGDNNKTKKFIDSLLEGKVYTNPNNAESVYNYLNKNGTKESTNRFIKKYADKKFVETVAEYEYNSTQSIDDDTEDGSSISSLLENKKKKKRVIIFTLID